MTSFEDIEPGRPSSVVSGHYGDPVRVEEAQWSRGRGMNNPRRPLFILLHGWGSNEGDIADFFSSYVSPFNDFVSLRAPLTLLDPSDNPFADDPAYGSKPGLPQAFQTGAFSWYHESVPQGEDLDRDIYQAARAVDQWVEESIPPEREVIPFGFSQGGALAVHLLRLNPARYSAAVCLSGFLAPGLVPHTHPGDKELTQRAPAVFYGYGLADDLVARFESSALSAFLEENTFLKVKEYSGLDHAVSLDECNDIRQWLMDIGASSGVM